MDQDMDIAEFIQRKKEQGLKLIGLGIWKGMDSNDFKAWLKNFKTSQEQYFAAWVIDWLVYRNEEHVESMLFDLLTRHLHNQWRLDNNPIYSPTSNPLEILMSKWNVDKSGVRYVTAVRKTDRDTKSGYRIINVLNHNLRVSERYNIKPEELEDAYKNSGVRTFLFFDDIIGTGEQMAAVLQEAAIDHFPDAFIYVLVCAAHETGIQYISQKFPRVKILCAEFIPVDSNLFFNLPLEDFSMQTVEEIHQWYIDFMNQKKVSPKMAVGRGDLGLVYAFQGSVPNNTLPLLFLETKLLSKLLNKRG